MLSIPSVHVLMPTFNVAALVEVALTSVFGQDYSNISILIADDGSQDDTPDILKTLANERVSVHLALYTDNKGIARRREQLVQLSNQIDASSYLVWLDADDSFTDARFITKLVQQMQWTKADMCLYNFSITYETDSTTLRQNAVGLIKDKQNSEAILNYIVSTPDHRVSIDTYPNVASFTSLGWTKAYSPAFKQKWPTSNLAYIFEDFAYMAALFRAEHITGFASSYRPVRYLRRAQSSTGNRTPAHFYQDVIQQLVQFKDNIGEVSLQRMAAAQQFVDKKVQQYEETLVALINQGSPGFSPSDLSHYQQAVRENLSIS